MGVHDRVADGCAVDHAPPIDVARSDPAREGRAQRRVAEREPLLRLQGARVFDAARGSADSVFGSGYGCGIRFKAPLGLVVLGLDQARLPEQIVRARILDFRSSEIGASGFELSLRPGPLRLGLCELRLRLLEGMLIIERTHLRQLGIPGHAIAGLNVADTAIGAAHLENPLHDSTGLECQIHLLVGFDADGILLLRGRLDLLDDAGTHGLNRGFRLFRLMTAGEAQRRCQEENFAPHQNSLPSARSNCAFAFQKAARALRYSESAWTTAACSCSAPESRTAFSR